ncbi:MAG TPA: magnesium-translocating P-type ATPase [Candidatus Ruthenibacterium merdavium]|uniref:Magnesium-transporting ATPase, P-type 1 n=1 Tax=Candidatus Ruthenibacterium merdavium TaxID=2838752 RepID=A0A9D2Q6K6_9FIRM|nr:magnesium-translocating P-type ATPase [Candidatus Ruthenibacterium merdavium]
MQKTIAHGTFSASFSGTAEKEMQKMKKRKELMKAAAVQARREQTAQRLSFAACADVTTCLTHLHSRITGLTEEQVDEHRAQFGANRVTHEKAKPLGARIVEAFINPFTAILLCLALVSCATDIFIPLWNHSPEEVSPVTVVIILTMVIISGTLRFVQESRSGHAAEKLLAMITTTCTVTRKPGGTQELALEELVVGDIIHLSAGDMVPADVRILEAKDLFISQSAMTGESDPVEKFAHSCEHTASVTDCSNLAFMGTNVISGAANAVVVAVGDDTLFGAIASSAASEPVETNFTKGVNAVSWVLIRFMLVMIPIVFFVNGFTKHDWAGAFLFAISVAVGLTPEMLPMIVTTCLAKGAVSMSRKKTIVKNLNSIQDFGAMDILCTDKTGTLTQDKVVLEYHMNVNGEDDLRVLRHAYLNSYFQTGYKNLMDVAIIERTEEQEAADPRLADLSQTYHKVDEIPFDFTRRRLSTVVEDRAGKRQMITKGAVEEMLGVCSFAEDGGTVQPLTDDVRTKILETVGRLNENGMRVIAIAQKSVDESRTAYSVQDESGIVLMGYLAFLDPPKESAAAAIRTLKAHGVTTKILTGDNDRVTRCICKQVGLPVHRLLLGEAIEAMSESELERAALETDVFAKLSPAQKARVVTALRNAGHTVGFMGDGINDAPAMKAADIGISVDTAVDVAKESADIILLEKNLMVLEQGIMQGRKTYANMIKYIKMTASSNFGNMFSVLAASALLPFLPMESVHLILLNLIYDLSCTAIPWDNVDEEFLAVPRKWEASGIGSFMLWIGPTSSVFDWLTYAFLYFVLCPMFVSGGVLFNDLAAHYSGAELLQMQASYIALFHAGWFVESMWSQTLVIHMIRTPKLPFLQSRASAGVTLLTGAGIALLTAIPFTPLGAALGLAPLPAAYFAYLIPCIILYMMLATSLKKAYVRHFGELL